MFQCHACHLFCIILFAIGDYFRRFGQQIPVNFVALLSHKMDAMDNSVINAYCFCLQLPPDLKVVVSAKYTFLARVIILFIYAASL